MYWTASFASLGRGHRSHNRESHGMDIADHAPIGRSGLPKRTAERPCRKWEPYWYCNAMPCAK
eukprot:9998532-Alexandrium_andersonii.AAC.1